jgi:hypothetical protein
MTCGFLSLSDEILAIVFNEVSDSQKIRDKYNLTLQQIHSGAPQSLLALCVVSKRCYRHATPLLYQSIIITPSRLHTLEEGDELGCGDRLREILALWTRDVSIKGAEFDWTTLEGVLQGLKHLEILRQVFFTWSLPI